MPNLVRVLVINNLSQNQIFNCLRMPASAFVSLLQLLWANTRLCILLQQSSTYNLYIKNYMLSSLNSQVQACNTARGANIISITRALDPPKAAETKWVLRSPQNSYSNHLYPLKKTRTEEGTTANTILKTIDDPVPRALYYLPDIKGIENYSVFQLSIRFRKTNHKIRSKIPTHLSKTCIWYKRLNNL